ncbi:MAG: phospholipase [Muribaculaceae bacterium]|nr:phospholipase [Muribaculaceae bacterium]
MTGAIIIAIGTALIGLILWLLDRRQRSTPTQTAAEPESEECCGMHAVCEKQLLSPVSPEYEYFDDEELDVFRGRSADSYSSEEIDMFRDVLLTLKEDEVPAWSKSIQLRGITLPSEVRDELIMIVSESRNT